ncbi:MAG: FAD-binding oxidoreductase [Campylobacterales bacterium]|nr:FAD-binding oxidoreductase [Campylobacterales bacterium]
MPKKRKIAIVGGGVSGVTAALYLGRMGLDITLFEEKRTLVDGPPWCHLHAGGNLYREISDEQCATLLKQSIDFAKFYPYVVDYRPTVLALPLDDTGMVEQLMPRLEYLKNEYRNLVEKDGTNEVLGKWQNYYKLYDRTKMEALKTKQIVSMPDSMDEWMIPVAKHLNLDAIQYPLIMVQEYGLNMFRLAAGSMFSLEKFSNIKIQIQSKVLKIKQEGKQWEVSYQTASGTTQSEVFDYLINASGFRSGEIDDMVDVMTQRMVEFKASYISKCDRFADISFPEIIFHGERGTPKGMAQFTPYPGGYFQLHGMTKEITLYENGLVANSSLSAQPKLDQSFLKKIDCGWEHDEIEVRTQKAIDHVARFIPSFSYATVGSKPLYGAQQIRGDDPSLRVAEVSFPKEGYARCEIVKVSSSIDMAKAIHADLQHLGIISKDHARLLPQESVVSLNEEKIKTSAQNIAILRAYPGSLSKRNRQIAIS